MNPKSDKELERKARLFALFSDPNRLRIVHFLSTQESANVSDIAKEITMSVACTSHHLQLLKDNQILEATREGTNIYYKMVNDSFIKKLQFLIYNQ